MANILNFLEWLRLIKSWSTAFYDPSQVSYKKSKLKIDSELRLIAVFTRDAVTLIRF